MKRILISGINGFVGSNLSTYLKNNQCEIFSLGRSDNNSANSFIWNNLNLLKETKFDAFVHLAGKAHDLKKSKNDNEYFIVNTELTKVLFDIFVQSDAKDFIYFSSVKAVADTVEGVLKEDAIPAPLTPYGKSKQQAEAFLLAQKLTGGKRLFIIRPCMIHGPGNKGNLNLLYKLVNSGIPYPLAAFKNSRSFLSIDNLNYIVEQILSDRLIQGGVYNVADDESLSTNDVIKIISRAVGGKSRLWSLNPGFIKIIALIGGKLGLPLNPDRLKKLTESYVVSNKKIKQALKIEHMPQSAEAGLLKTIKSFNSNGADNRLND